MVSKCVCSFIKCVCSNLNCRQRLVLSCSLWHACSHCVNQGGQKMLFGIGTNLLVKSSKNYFHLLALIDLYLIIFPYLLGIFCVSRLHRFDSSVLILI